jgi:3-deoxy-D-manno-octulosonic-acid transferase
LWIHAVSVGEVQTTASLVHALRAETPDLEILLSTVTATGSARARALHGDRVRHVLLPYDVPFAVRRFVDQVRPHAVVVLETEIWPNLYRELGRRGIPLMLASARLSPRSVDRFRRVDGFIRRTLADVAVIAAQTETDAARFRAIGAPAERVQVCGNVKFDLRIPDDAIESGRAFRRSSGATRPVWIAGSTREGEEEAVLDAHTALRERFPRSLLVLAPRHPERFETVRAMLRSRGLGWSQRSDVAAARGDDAVYLLDGLGELQMLYAAADVAFVGGSLVPVGGHNLLEPAVLGLPVLSGPHVQNSQQIADLLRSVGALTIVHDPTELAARVGEAFADPDGAAATGARGREAVAQSRGAVDRIVRLIETLLSQAASSEAPAAPGSASSRAALDRG